MTDKSRIPSCLPLMKEGKEEEIPRGLWLPGGLEEAAATLSRRRFMQLMGASLALAGAGLTGCRRPVEKIVPYLSTPEEEILGLPNYYATTMPFGMEAYGLVVESHEGRPTKIEGNPLHPSTPRGSNAYMQASVLDLYDPDRSRSVLHAGKAAQWSEFVAFWQTLSGQFQANGGTGLAVLSESYSSPTLWRLRQVFLQRFPQAKWVAYEPVSDENILAGIEATTGQQLRPVYHVDQANVILALDADFLGTESDNVRLAHQFALSRTVRSPQDGMNRLYAVDSIATITGGLADYRLKLLCRQVGAFAAALALELQNMGISIPGIQSLGAYATPPFDANFLKAAARDLASNRGKCLVLAGRRQPAAVHALVLAINQALGNIGTAVGYHPLSNALASDRTALADLFQAMTAGTISTLIVLGGDPAYNAPADFTTLRLLPVNNVVHLNLRRTATTSLAAWHLNQAHFLESWGDAQSAPGYVSIIQPLIAPLHGGKSLYEVANLLATGQDQSGYDVVRATWTAILPAAGFESHWRQVLHDGVLDGSASEPVAVQVDGSALASYLAAHPFPVSNEPAAGLEAVFLPSYALWDGRFANNAWQQELPDPITKVTWDNPALISPKTAADLKLETGDMVTLNLEGRSLELPVWVEPTQADGSVGLILGYGQQKIGAVGQGVGFDVYSLRTSAAPDFAQGLSLKKAGGHYLLATSQPQRTRAQRPVYRYAELPEFYRNPKFAREAVEIPGLQSLWKEHTYEQGYQWGMAIDLTLCTGCSTCVTACRAENNVAVVGKERVHQGRIMHWLRVDNYYVEDADGRVWMAYQPIPCMHCEMAPCEQVCPVEATAHSHEGLNMMTYNRCVGTRYCSNNCPYKVRRFNFFNYTAHYPELVKMVQNPDVTVRSRGVMEKCSYCLQRITRAKFQARMENREIRDGEVVPACAQACPTGAIVFGNVNDPDSRVAKLKQLDQNYAMLAEYNTRPRTSYMARLRNI